MTTSPDPAHAPNAQAQQIMLRGNALAAISMMTWAAGFPAAEVLLDSWDPLALIAARLMLTVAVLIPLWALIDGPGALWRANWPRGIWVGGLCFGLGMYLFLVAQKLTDPVTVALIASAAPITAAVLEFANGSRRPTVMFLIGLGLTVIGGAFATSGTAMADIGLGAALAVISAFLFSWGSLAAVRDFPDLSPLGRTTITFAGGFVIMAGLALITQLSGGDLTPSRPFDAHQASMLAIFALGSMALSQLLFISAVGRIGIALASLHINIAPFYVMVIMLTLGEAWSWQTAMGASIVALGVIVSQQSPQAIRRLLAHRWG